MTLVQIVNNSIAMQRLEKFLSQLTFAVPQWKVVHSWSRRLERCGTVQEICDDRQGEDSSAPGKRKHTTSALQAISSIPVHGIAFQCKGSAHLAKRWNTVPNQAQNQTILSVTVTLTAINPVTKTSKGIKLLETLPATTQHFSLCRRARHCSRRRSCRPWRRCRPCSRRSLPYSRCSAPRRRQRLKTSSS